jgi:hypothetical protein
MNELIQIFTKDNQMLQVMRRINEIDRDHNGYVTCIELDDIVKLAYPHELKGKSLLQLFKPYASI